MPETKAPPEQKNKTIVAFDFGLKNIGIALGQSAIQIASPLPPIKARDGIPDWQILQSLITEWQPSLAIVGLPLNMDGTESEMSLRARKFANRIQGRFSIPVELFDERLTSREAKAMAVELGHNGHYSKQPIDSIAAKLILEYWWLQQK